MPVSPVVTPSPGVGEHGYVTIVDQQGYVIGTIASSDGAPFGSISGESQFLFNSGGPPLLDGSPSQLTFDRARGYLGKNSFIATISSTGVGDVALSFSAAPKNIMPGQAIKLSGGALTEYVIVAPSPTFTPSATATSIPLVSPVVNAGQTSATWDTFSPFGPNNQNFGPVGVGLQALAIVGAPSDRLGAATSAVNDGAFPITVLETAAGRLGSSGNIDRLRNPDTFKSFNAQAVTISSANTPTAIWTPTSGKKFRLMGYWFSSTVACSILFHDLTSVGSGGVMPIPSPIMAAAGIVQSPPIGNGILSATINNKLWIDATAATTLTGFVFGIEE